MKVIKAGFEYLTPFNGLELVKTVERAGRLCYASSDKITEDSYKKFLQGIIKRGHTSVLEHASIGVILTVDRGVTHEIVRHRTGVAYSQMSTRYCDTFDGKGGGEITVISPIFWNDDRNETHTACYKIWEGAMRCAEADYFAMLKKGAKPQEARSVLPNSLATKIAVTANLREWRHIFYLRCDKPAHPQMREIMLLLLENFYTRVPVVFDDLYEKFESDIAEVHALRED